jgi:hypothetical protein
MKFIDIEMQPSRICFHRTQFILTCVSKGASTIPQRALRPPLEQWAPLPMSTNYVPLQFLLAATLGEGGRHKERN